MSYRQDKEGHKIKDKFDPKEFLICSPLKK